MRHSPVIPRAGRAAGATPVGRPAGPALLLLAHGSRDRRSVSATRALARAAAHHDVVAVPLLLTAAYHSRVDVPAVLAAFPGVRRADVLGPDPRLLDALIRRLSQVPSFDALVLAGAGSSDAGAVASVAAVGAALGERYGVPARPGFASAATPVEVAVRELRAGGARRVAVASYFLAPGLLHDRVVTAARDAGAVGVAEPLVAVPELVDVVLDRYEARYGTLVAA